MPALGELDRRFALTAGYARLQSRSGTGDDLLPKRGRYADTASTMRDNAVFEQESLTAPDSPGRALMAAR